MTKTLSKLALVIAILTVSACQQGYNGTNGGYYGNNAYYGNHSSYYGNHSSYYGGRTANTNNIGWWGNNAGYTDNDLAHETYKAVDRITRQANMAPGNTIPVVIGTLANVNTMEKSHSFGRVVTEQVSSRMTQRGHNVSELRLRNSVNIKQGHEDIAEAGEFMLTRDIDSIRGEYKIGRVVTGTYGIAGQEIMVNLKMIDIATGKILGATDYAVKLDSNTSKLIQDNAFSFYGSSMAY